MRSLTVCYPSQQWILSLCWECELLWQYQPANSRCCLTLTTVQTLWNLNTSCFFMSSWQLLSVITHNATRSLNFSIMFKSFLWSVELIGFSLLFSFSSVPNRMPQEMWSQGKSPKQFAHIKKKTIKEGNVMFADIWMLYLVIPSCIKWILLSTWRNMRRAECSVYLEPSTL